MERVRPVLFLNKYDRIFLEMQMEDEQIYSTFRKVIENVNVIIQTYGDKTMPDLQLSPDDCTVAFGSGLQAWAFTIDSFYYNNYLKNNPNKDIKMPNLKKLWGDNFIDPITKTQSKINKPGMIRTFCYFFIKPIRTIHQLAMSENVSDKDKLTQLCAKLGLKWKHEFHNKYKK